MTTKKKSGAPDPKYFESADTIGKFDPVRQWLIKNFKKVCKKWLKCVLYHFIDSISQLRVCEKSVMFNNQWARL